MTVCNYTVGQADSDNTWASMQDNGSHIISFNISLVDPGDRDISLEQVCDEMREDLKKYPEFSKAQVILGVATRVCLLRQVPTSRYMVIVGKKPTV